MVTHEVFCADELSSACNALTPGQCYLQVLSEASYVPGLLLEGAVLAHFKRLWLALTSSLLHVVSGISKGKDEKKNRV